MNTVEAKFAAIQYLINNGSHHSEWAEAGLLHAIETVVTVDNTDLSESNLQEMIDQAANY